MPCDKKVNEIYSLAGYVAIWTELLVPLRATIGLAGPYCGIGLGRATMGHNRPEWA